MSDPLIIFGLILAMIVGIGLFCVVAVLRLIGGWTYRQVTRPERAPPGFEVLPPAPSAAPESDPNKRSAPLRGGG